MESSTDIAEAYHPYLVDFSDPAGFVSVLQFFLYSAARNILISRMVMKRTPVTYSNFGKRRKLQYLSKAVHQ